MSKLPNHTIWTRATTSSGRSTAVLGKSHNSTIADHNRRGYYTQRSENARQNEITSGADASELALMGAISAPYHGPQPAAVVKIYERQQQHQIQQIEEVPSLSNLSNYVSLPAFSFPSSLTSLISSSHNVAHQSALRNGLPLSLISPSPIRNLHVWSQVQAQAQTQSNTYNSNDENAMVSTKVVSSSKRRSKKQNKLLFDISESARDSSSLVKGKGKSAEHISTSIDDDRSVDGLYELMAALMKSQQKKLLMTGKETYDHNQNTGKRKSKQSTNFSEEQAEARPYIDSSGSFDTNKALPEASPSHSPSPSPGPSSERSRDQVGFRSNIPDVNGPKPKFAVTTSAESSISSNTAGDGSSSKSAKLQYLASTSSATPPQGSSSSLPPQASSSSGSTEHWAKTFRLPRSTKDHEFMFEHGAYGIPKRHPLSSIRKASSGFNGKGERTAPSRDVVPTSKVRAATDMLAAAAEFLAGSQSIPANAANTSEFRPSRGNDALQAALAGGSTAEGYEVQQHFIEANKADADTKTGAHRMAIRGPDGRVIKERLRSVQVGEDAYFLRPDALGVADGVGGWASRPGADPALFSRLLMHFCAVELSRYDGLSASELAADNGSLLKAWASVDAVEVMHRAWERCVRASRREGILGSSTALIGILRGEELRIANMGDCVLMIIRGGEMMFRSTEQQHSFNFPVQLGMMGDTTDTIKKHVMASQNRDRAAGEGEVASGAMEDYDAVEEDRGSTKAQQNVNGSGKSRNDTAPPVTPDRQSGEDFEPDWDEPRRDAGRWTVRVKAGDIIVVGSDGLMDNLFDEDIIEEVIRFLPPSQANAEGEEQEVKIDASNFSPQMVSEALCSRAKAVSEDSRAISSPFQQRAMEEGLNYVGGKHDDISVLVCLVGERDGLVFETEGEQKDEHAQEEVKAERAQI